MSLDLESFRQKLARLAQQGIWIGTSSWKYPGWCGQVYDPARYVWRGRFSEARFERQCLAEYGGVFKTVCVDAAYYKFPAPGWIEARAAQVPPDFLFTLKVTDEITVKRFTHLPRFGARAGQANPNFLNAALFESAFLKPCEPGRNQVGLLMFEFSHFHPAEFARGRDFVEALDQFLGQLPGGWRYGVEVRNPSFLHPEYFAMLARHGVAHVFNSWAGMPPVEEQAALPQSLTGPFFGARFLLRPGRNYQEAVDQFSPYERIQDPYPAGQAAGAALIRRAQTSAGRLKGFIYVNNRLEGNAPHTIAAMLEQAAG